jgi:hypothetical protein
VGFCQSSVELTRAVLVEKPEQAAGSTAQIAAVKCDLGKERLSGAARREAENN